jgi:peptidoglycan-associated lipoprotein
VYFAFDSSTLSSAARDKIQSNAQCIRERDMSQVQLVGHCDPRGTEEYNLALGERRARSVKKYLTSLGVSGDKLGVSSMGEEMADGTGPDTWPDDRRVELKQR